MIKLFRKIRHKLLNENKFSKYLIYAIGEIALVVVGILIALQVNNWNESRKEERLKTELINLMITDIKIKIDEMANDHRAGQTIVHRKDTLIQVWKNTKRIDTTYLSAVTNDMGADHGSMGINSPVYGSISNSDLWRKLPDTITLKIESFYRINIKTVNLSFINYSKYAYEQKINFLTPNDLIDKDNSTLEIFQLLNGKEESFIRRVKLTRDGMATLVGRWKSAIDKGNDLIYMLETYNNNK